LTEHLIMRACCLDDLANSSPNIQTVRTENGAQIACDHQGPKSKAFWFMTAVIYCSFASCFANTMAR
jgi:hypothetical protein